MSNKKQVAFDKQGFMRDPQQSSAGAGQRASAGDEDVVDAEFEDVSGDAK